MMRFYWPQQEGEEALQQLKNKKPFAPFDEVVLSFIQALSKRFVKMREYPEIVALGFWLRKAHMKELQHDWEKQSAHTIVKPRGTVFHLAPSNVDTIFIYCWMLSLLAGNRNIIRVSSKEQVQINLLLTSILEELSNPQFQDIAERTIVLTYSHNDVITEKLSKLCHTRVVWGGDATVHAIRKIALAPMANELVFPDRFSMSMIEAEAVNDIDQAKLKHLAEKFYNDSFWYDQMACSSPRLIVWVGNEQAVAKAQEVFWQQVEQVILKKQYNVAAATQIQKFTTGLWLAAEPETIEVNRQTTHLRVQLNHITDQFRERHCGGGFFYETIVEQPAHIADIVIDKDQTLSYFGFSKDQLIELTDHIETRGIDRIIPIGQALDFQSVWDGQSFLRSFTREVVIL